MYKIEVDLDISADEYLKHYQGVAKFVRATSRDGRTVHFPTNILQPFVRREGVQGRFIIWFDQDNKFQRIERSG